MTLALVVSTNYAAAGMYLLVMRTYYELLSLPSAPVHPNATLVVAQHTRAPTPQL